MPNTLASSSPVPLPDVTVVCATTVAHDLTAMALADTLKEIAPAEVVIWSDRPAALMSPLTSDGRCLGIYVDKIASIQEWYRIIWYEVATQVHTSHFLVVQWDGWVLNGRHWSNDWLQYDYIGAVWPWHGTNRVGNGGFRLTSTRLARFLATHRAEYPIRWPDDDLVCRTYRGALELTHGFVWAPEDRARSFSIEHGEPYPEGSFGFHDCRNWPHLLTHTRLVARIDAADEFTKAKPEFQEMLLYTARLGL